MRYARNLALSLAFLCATPANAYWFGSNKKIDYEERMAQFREVSICALNDIENPLPIEDALKLLKVADTEYRENVNIGFRTVAFGDYTGKLDLSPENLARSVQSHCPEEAELQVVFTTSKKQNGETEEGDPNYILGEATHVYGTFVMYDAANDMKDAGKHPAIRTTMIHEIGHLFGQGVQPMGFGLGAIFGLADTHNAPEESFMFRAMSRSQGLWTEEDIKGILRYKNTTWTRLTYLGAPDLPD